MRADGWECRGAVELVRHGRLSEDRPPWGRGASEAHAPVAAQAQRARTRARSMVWES